MRRRSDHPHVVWRDGKPRFQPGPSLRLDGHKGKDLRHEDGRWFTKAEAVEWSRRFLASLPAKPSRERLAPRSRPLSGDYERGFVYFLWAGEAIKIGYAKNPFTRTSQLLTGVSAPMRMFFCVRGTKGDEARLHRRLRSQKLRGEWFKASLATIRVLRMVLNENDGLKGDNIPCDSSK